MDVGLEIRSPEMEEPREDRCDVLHRLARKIAPTYGLKPIYLMGIIKNESSCGKNSAPKEEPGSIGYAIRAVGSRAKKYWSSWGVGQVMGYRAKSEYGLEPEELEDDETAMEVTAAAFKKCLDEQQGTEIQKLFKASACYNGGSRWQRSSGNTREKILKYGLRYLEHLNMRA